MGYKLRRALRVALGAEIAGLQRAVALEIADDANDDTRMSMASLEDLALWTAAKDENVVRNALKRLSAAGWEFRVPLGKGKDGRVLYAVPGRRLTFRVPEFEGVSTAPPKGESSLPLPPEGGTSSRFKGEPPLLQGVAGAPSEGAPARSERAPATPISSDSSITSSLSAPAEPPSMAAAGEREKEHPQEPDGAQAVAEAWAAARGSHRNPSAERSVQLSAGRLLAEGWPLSDVVALAQDMAAKYPAGTDLARHEPHWERPKASVPRARCTECRGTGFVGDEDHPRRCPACKPSAASTVKAYQHGAQQHRDEPRALAALNSFTHNRGRQP